MSHRLDVTRHEPTVETIELMCDRLADLGLAIGPDVARDLVQAILTAEAPRLDRRLREALGASLETIRVATQSAIGALTTAAVTAPSHPAVQMPSPATKAAAPPAPAVPLTPAPSPAPP